MIPQKGSYKRIVLGATAFEADLTMTWEQAIGLRWRRI